MMFCKKFLEVNTYGVWNYFLNVERFSIVTFYLFFSSAIFLLTSCCIPRSCAYQQQYAHLKSSFHSSFIMQESPYYLVFLVDACHLDYTDNHSFFRTVAKHPSDSCKNGTVGHAWIYLHGMVNGKEVVIEGGHSGELGLSQSKYFDGIMNYIDYGYANPTYEQKCVPRNEPNPIKYLWEEQQDGFFQKGSGGHRPTFAAKIDLTKEQFDRIVHFINPKNYNYSHYALTGNQCSSFVVQVAALADFFIESNIKMKIEKNVYVGGRQLTLWQDSRYSVITFSTPDIIEKSLMGAVKEGRAEYALSWYLSCQKRYVSVARKHYRKRYPSHVSHCPRRVLSR